MSQVIINDADIEAYVLGVAIDSLEDRADILAQLTINDFIDPVNNLIARGLYEVEKNSYKADFLTIQNKIKNLDIELYTEKKIGNRLAEIIKPKTFIEIKNLKQAIETIKRYTMMRMLNRYLSKQLAEIQDYNFNPKEKTTQIIEDLLTLLEKKTHEQTKHIKYASDEVEKRLKYGDSRSVVHTNFEELDNKIVGFKEGQLVVIAGRSGMGKTALIVDIADTFSCNNLETMIFSLEMNDEELTERLLANNSGVELYKIHNEKYRSQKDKDTLYSYLQDIKEKPIYINDTPLISIEEMTMEIRRSVIKNNVKAVIIDHLQIINTPNNQQRHRELDIMTARLKALAKELKIPIILLSQLSRESEKRTDKRPMLSDLKESGGIEQNADIVLGIYRQSYYDKSDDLAYEIIILKNRNGAGGTANLFFEPTTMRFSNTRNFTGKKEKKEDCINYNEYNEF